MLYYQTIDSKTLELLKKLQSVKEFKKLYLVGGTALALQLGHRKSVDIDLFGKLDIDKFQLNLILKSFDKVQLLNETENIHVYSIDGIKVDIVNYPYPWIEEQFVVDNIVMAHPHDIMAMKIATIIGRGTKKDFIDIYFSLKNYTLKQILSFYTQKFYDGSIFLALKSLTYFEDANQNEPPIMFSNIRWENVKDEIKNKVNLYFSEI